MVLIENQVFFLNPEENHINFKVRFKKSGGFQVFLEKILKNLFKIHSPKLFQ